MFQIEEKYHVQYNAHCSRDGGCETDIGEACVRLDTHIVSEGKADEKGLDQSLEHDPHGLAITVEISHHTEQHCGCQRLRCKPLQLLIASLHHCRIRGEDACQQIPSKEHQYKGEASHQKSDADTGEHGLLRPLLFSGTYIL